MNSSIDQLLAAASIIVSALLLFGKGEIFLSPRTAEEWKRTFDLKKVERGYGIAFLLIGIATIISMQYQSRTAAIIYLVSVVVIFGASVIYMYGFCKKKDDKSQKGKNKNSKSIISNNKKK